MVHLKLAYANKIKLKMELTHKLIINSLKMFEFFRMIFHLLLIISKCKEVLSFPQSLTLSEIYSNWPHATFCLTLKWIYIYSKTIILFKHLFSISFRCAIRVHHACVNVVNEWIDKRRKKNVFNLKLEVIKLSFTSAYHSKIDRLFFIFYSAFTRVVFVYLASFISFSRACQKNTFLWQQIANRFDFCLLSSENTIATIIGQK